MLLRRHRRRSSNNFAIRKNLLEYDQVNNEQRELIYEERRRVLKGESMHDEIVRMIGDVVKAEINDVIDEGQTPAEWNLLLLNRTLLPIAPIKPLSMNKDDYKGYTTERLIDEVCKEGTGDNRGDGLCRDIPRSRACIPAESH